MTGFLPHHAITASLFQFWSDRFNSGTTTVYPGMKVDTVSLSEWVELWVDAWSRRPQRSAGTPFVELTVTVHCFVRSGPDAGRLHALTDLVRATFAQAVVPLIDFTVSDTPEIGTIRLKEAETRNLTRRDTGTLQVVLHHTAVVIRGVVQAQ